MLLKQYCGGAQKSHSFINNSLVYLLSLLTFSTLIIQTFISYTPLLGLVYTQLKIGEKDIVFNPLQNNRLNSTRFAQGLDMDIVPRISEQFVINNKTLIHGQFINISKYPELAKYSIFNQSKHRIYVHCSTNLEIQKEGTLAMAVSSYLSLVMKVIDRYSLSEEEKRQLMQDLNVLMSDNLTISGEVEFIKIGPQIVKKLKVQYGGDYYLFMDMGSTFQYLFKSSWKSIVQKYNISQSLLSLIQNPHFSLYHFTKQIIANFHNRFEIYRLLSQQQIREKINSYLNKAANTFDLSSFDSYSPVISNAYAFSLVNIIISLLSNFIIFLFLMLCYTALNSTMHIKMQLQKKNIIIMKLLGANSIQLSIRIIKSILKFIILSNIIGISASILVLHGLSYTVSDILDRNFSFAYDQSTILSVIFIGFVLPLSIASLYAYHGLKNVKVSNLGEGQQQIQEVRAEVYVQDQKLSISTLVLASVVTVYGFLIYFMLPLVFNRGNTQAISTAFVVFIYGVAIGGIKLLDTFEYLFQKLIAKLSLFRLDKFLYNLILKNLSINRKQNRKISLVYMMSTISLITISLNAQFQINGSMKQFLNFRGGHIEVTMDFTPQFYNNLLSKLPQVKAYSFITKYYQQYFPNDRQKILMSDMTKTYYFQTTIYGVAGPFFPNQQKWRLSATYTDVEEPFGFLGWLNTEKGQATAVVGQNMVRELDLKSSIDKRFLINIVRNNSILRYPMKISTVNTKHLTLFFTYKDDRASVVGVNIDVFKSITGIPEDQFRFGRILIQLEDLKYTQTVVNEIKKAIDLNKLQFNQIWNLQSQYDSLRSVLNILRLTLKIIMVLFTIICFSSLSSTNYISVQNQARSIGILLSLGLQENKIRKIYKYETFILLLCTSIKSIIISHFLSTIIVYQRDLFSNSDPENTFQIDTYIFVILLAAVSSYFSSNKALDQIFTKSISHMMKRKD